MHTIYVIFAHVALEHILVSEELSPITIAFCEFGIKYALSHLSFLLRLCSAAKGFYRNIS